MNKIITDLRNISFVLIMVSAMISCSKEKIDVKIPVTNIKLSSELEVIEIDSDIVLKADVLPENATNKNITWSSQDDKIVTVDKNGKVHAVSAGTAVVIAKAEGSKINSTCKVTVKAAYIPIEEIVFAETVKSIVIGETFTPEVNIIPEDATDKTLVWTSSNEEIASVDDKGLVTSKNTGEVTITAKSIRNNKTINYSLIIRAEYIPIKEIVLVKPSDPVTLGCLFLSIFTFSPSNTTDRTLVWSSSNEEIASVDYRGLVTTKQVGQVTITATSTKDKKSASYVLNIKKGDISLFYISFNYREVNVLKGSKYISKINLNPYNTTEKIIWTSSNSDIAIADDKGVITAIQVGEVTITASGEKSEVSASYNLKVVDTHIPITEIKFSKYSDKTLAIGYKNKLRCFILPKNATDKTLIWTSSNSNVASVDDSGVVTGKQLGDVIITVASVKDNIKSNFNLKIENLNLRFEFDISYKMVCVGERFYNFFKRFPYYVNDIELTWSSSNEYVAIVDNGGDVIAKNVGRARITVSYNDVSSYFDVEVVAKS